MALREITQAQVEPGQNNYFPWGKDLSQNAAKYAIIDFGQVAEAWGAYNARLLKQEIGQAAAAAFHGSSGGNTSKVSALTTDRTRFAWTARR